MKNKVIPFLFWGLLAAPACGDDDAVTSGSASGDGPDNTGQECTMPDACYPGVDQSELAGEVECLDRVDSGYCTHQCETDADCCAVAGVCDDNIAYVCGPFESTGLMLCFISCEEADIDASGFGVGVGGGGGGDPADTYCQAKAHAEFICRSTGGGSDNRKVCVPEG